MKCVAEGCDLEGIKRGMCGKHYQRWKIYGDPNISKRKYTSRGEPLRYLHEVIVPHEGDECLPWPYACNGMGYGVVVIAEVTCYVHTVVCEIVYGPKPSQDYIASHKCGNGHLACANPRHLRWQTRTEDCEDRVIHGTVARGSGQWNSRLTEDQVLEIRALSGKLSQKEIAKQFDIDPTTVSDIIRRKSWDWLSEKNQIVSDTTIQKQV
jgi:hypothetical protein